MKDFGNLMKDFLKTLFDFVNLLNDFANPKSINMNLKSCFVNPLAENANLETTFASLIFDLGRARARMGLGMKAKWFRQFAGG